MAKAYEELELKDDFMFSVIMRDPKYVTVSRNNPKDQDRKDRISGGAEKH